MRHYYGASGYVDPMTKREADLKSELFEGLHARYPGFVVQQMASAGSPDRSVTGNGRTTHWEFKHGTPDFISPGLQELTCLRLAKAGHCRYVIWQEKGEIKRTLIVHPKVIKNRTNWNVVPETFCIGFDLVWLIAQIIKEHE